jgi:hypothetical protein
MLHSSQVLALRGHCGAAAMGIGAGVLVLRMARGALGMGETQVLAHGRALVVRKGAWSVSGNVRVSWVI